MNIHHHPLHVCPACSCCPCCHARREAAPSETEEPRSRLSFLETLGDLARVAAVLSLLHITRDRGDTPTARGGEQDSTVPLARPSAEMPARRDDKAADATEPLMADAFLALFSQAAREHDRSLSTTDARRSPIGAETKPPLSPLAAAFLAAFSDDESQSHA